MASAQESPQHGEKAAESRTPGVALIGAGRILQDHTRAFGQLRDRATLVGVADPDPSQLRAASERYFVPVATADYRELLERRDVDLVVVATPPAAHEAIVLAALAAGKYVVCEKPLAHTLAAADRIIGAAEAHPGRLSVVYQLRYLPEVQRLLWLRDRGRLGRLLYGHVHRSERPPAVSGAGSPWWGRWETAGGGATMTQFIHQLDLLLQVFGPAEEVRALMSTQGAGIESEDTFAASIRFRSGAIAGCSCCAVAQRSEFRFDVVGEKASVHHPWRVVAREPWQGDRLDGEARAAHPAPDPLRRPSLALRGLRRGLRLLGAGGAPAPPASRHLPYLRAVLDAMADGAALPVGPAEARASLELCVALYTAALQGQPVRLPLPRSGYYAGVSAADYAAAREGA